jgi:hypothetical protein
VGREDEMTELEILIDDLSEPTAKMLNKAIAYGYTQGDEQPLIEAIKEWQHSVKEKEVEE